MADLSFSHITIGEDDADEVIQAGIVETPQVDEPEVQPQSEPQEPEAQSEVQPEPVVEPQPAPKDSVRDDGYRETTLDDLKGSPMPFAQKAVLVAAVLLIVAAVAYWFLR